METTKCSQCNGAGQIPVGSSLRDIRHQAGLSLVALGKMGGVSAPHLCDVELGKRRVTPRIIRIYGLIGLGLTETTRQKEES